MGRRLNLVTACLGLLNLGAWGVLVYLGVTGVHAVSAQHTPGYPTSSQITLFIYIPIAAFVIAAATTAVCTWRPQDKWFLWPVLCLCLLGAPGCLAGYGGGV
jgi:hypothetical protein